MKINYNFKKAKDRNIDYSKWKQGDLLVLDKDVIQDKDFKQDESRMKEYHLAQLTFSNEVMREGFRCDEIGGVWFSYKNFKQLE